MTDSTNKRIFITGACGFIGLYLVEYLLKSTNYQLLLNCRTKAGNIINERISYHAIDLNSATEISSFIKSHNIYAIIHLSAMANFLVGEKNPDKAVITNYKNTKLLLNLAEKNRINKFVFLSSDLVRNFQSVVGISKYLSEWDFKNGKDSLTDRIIVRLPNVSYTPGSVHIVFQRLIDKRKSITITHPDMSRRFISGEEAATYILYALEQGKDKDLFVVNKPPKKITDLAKEMMSEKGIKVDLNYIGMRPGEKLLEEPYDDNELTYTSFKDLALLKEFTYDLAEKENAMNVLKAKPGFDASIIEEE